MLAAAALAAFIGVARADTYYVDAAGGDNANDGKSVALAWKSVAKVNAFRFRPGDRILFKRGETWRETLNTPASGSAAEPITFGAYGDGDRPTISAADVKGAWTREAGNAYSTPLANEPTQVFEDGVPLRRSASLAQLAPGGFTFDGGGARLLVRTSDDSEPARHVIEVDARAHGIVVDEDYITLEDLHVTKGNAYGIYLDDALTNLTIRGMLIDYNYFDGINGYGPNGPMQHVNVLDCEVAYNGANGIHMSDNSQHWLIRGNTVHNNSRIQSAHPFNDYSAGIKGNGTPIPYAGRVTFGILIENNKVFDNGRDAGVTGGDRGAGIWLDTVGTDAVIRHNLVYGNRFIGIFAEVSHDIQIAYNVVYDVGGVNPHTSVTFGIAVSGRNAPEEAGDNKVYGNTVWNDLPTPGLVGIAVYGNGGPATVTGTMVGNNIAIGFPRNLAAFRGGENDGRMGSGNVYTHNAFGVQAKDFVQWGESSFFDTYLDTYKALDAALGAPAHNVETDPLLVNPGAGDFALQAASPAIGAGADLGPGNALGLAAPSSWPGDVRTRQNGQNGSAWDVGAFIHAP